MPFALAGEAIASEKRMGCIGVYPAAHASKITEVLVTWLLANARLDLCACVVSFVYSFESLVQATHDFFRREGFLYLQSPIITASDCEGAGEMFSVTTLPTQVRGARGRFLLTGWQQPICPYSIC